MGRLIGVGLILNYFDFPPGAWPPRTPARHYIGQFLEAFKSSITGRCVEFSPPYYRERYGNLPNVSRYDVWNVTASEDATIVGDLQHAPHVPDQSFDTIICTHVLCSLERPWKAAAEMHRMLAPGGVVLCTNPVVLQAYAPHPLDCWRFTPDSMRSIFSMFRKVEVLTYGNPATVAASPMFLMDYHLSRRVVEQNDERCPSVVATAAWK
jgi:SAM-dependent methyltransferase